MSVGPSVEARALQVRSAGGRVILDIPELDIAGGTAVAIRGPSGAGKSTLLYALAGLIAPQEGAVRWDGDDLFGKSEAERVAFRRRMVGFIFQEHLLFEELTALQNAALAASYAPRAERRSIREGARAGLARLGLEHLSDARSQTMSGGERQRVAVARALANDPPVILADEPTASLDRAHADQLTADLVGLARAAGRTLIAVSHDAHLHAAMDRIVDLVDGRLARPAPEQVA